MQGESETACTIIVAILWCTFIFPFGKRYFWGRFVCHFVVLIYLQQKYILHKYVHKSHLFLKKVLTLYICIL